MSIKNLPGILAVAVIFFVQTAYAVQDRRYAPSDLPVPVLDSTGFIIDPDHRIDEEWRMEMIGSRETYFFCRYVEPVCVRVDHIRDPEDVEAYADKLVELWDLEKKTNGRFVLQLLCLSKQKAVYRIGSRLKEFYKAPYLRRLRSDIEHVHLSTDESVGTGDFVSLQSLGANIFEELAYDPAIYSYEGNNGKHTYYPDEIVLANGQLTEMETSIYRGCTDLNATSAVDERVEGASVKNYFSGLTQAQIDENYARINTSHFYRNISWVPNMREQTGSHVSDPDQILGTFAADTIDILLKQLENELGYQVAVVCLNSIGENDPHSYGTDLFNRWGIGEEGADNGLLMLLVHDQHAIEFITGRGTEGILTDIDCYNIQQQEMVPYFKSNDYVTGMIRGTQAVCDFFYGSPPLYYSADDYPSNDSEYDFTTAPDDAETSNFWPTFFLYYFSFAGILAAGWIVVLFLAFFIRDLHKRYHAVKFFTLTIWIFLFPVPFILVYLVTKRLMQRWRDTERFSPVTGELMHKLGDHEEDKHLNKGQLTEEKVKSIDYDVWVTIGGTDVLILSYKRWFSKYNKCISCRFKTYFKEYDRTLVAATYTSSGTGERKYRCENCGHSKVQRYTIPRRTQSSSGSGVGRSSGFSGGGGSSWGGGSSRGGGAGSRW